MKPDRLPDILDAVLEAYPTARVLVPAKRIPFTSNGKRRYATSIVFTRSMTPCNSGSFAVHIASHHSGQQRRGDPRAEAEDREHTSDDLHRRDKHAFA